MTSHAICRLFAAAAFAGGLASQPVAAITLGQTDTFTSSSTLGWRVGPAHPTPPSVVANGGPGGAGDGYLVLQALGGSGPASHLAVENRLQWAGDFPAAGITGLTVDVNNLGGTDLSLRLLFDTFSGLRAWSTVSLSVPVGSGWQSLYFPIGSSELTTLGGVPLGSALSQVISMRIFHSTDSTFPGEAIVARLGLDNVTAVPEPGAGWLLALGLGALAWRRSAQQRASSRADQ